MKYSILGKTGKLVSSIGLGGGQFGIYNEKITKEEGAQVVKHAYQSGINYFDTSPFYGYNSGQSEMTFGEGLKGIDRSTFYMATKVGRYGRDVLNMFDFSAETTEASVKRSLEYLQMDYIDCVQVHDMEYAEDLNQILTETLPALDRLRQRGLIKCIGLGTYSLSKIRFVLENSPVQIDTVLNHSCLTLIDQELRDYIDYFKGKGVGIINATPLAHGFLINRPLPAFLSIADPELIAASRKAVSLCQKEGYSIERLAVSYSGNEGDKLGVNVLLTGSDSIPQLDANIRAICEGLTPDEHNMCARLRRDIFAKLRVRNWNHNDVATYHEKLQAAREGKQVCWGSEDK